MLDFPRITIRPDQMGGVPCIRSLRMPVATVVRMVANGRTTAEILSEFPGLQAEDIVEALRYAADLAERPMRRPAEMALSLLDQAQRNATLSEEAADEQAVVAARAVRATASRGRR